MSPGPQANSELQRQHREEPFEMEARAERSRTFEKDEAGNSQDDLCCRQISTRGSELSEDGRSAILKGADEPDLPISTLRRVFIVFQLAGINVATCAVNGLLVIGLPAIIQELHMAEAMTVWPSSVTSLTTAATLLLAGTVADHVGPRTIGLVGSFACSLLMLGAGASSSGRMLIGIRAVQGVALSCHLASSVALITQSCPRGRPRNVAFACLGLSQPLGFSLGLVLGGVLVDTIGWRAGWYIHGAITLALTALGFFILPKTFSSGNARAVLRRLRDEVDWVGALLISGFMGVISTFLAMISIGPYQFSKPGVILLLCLSTVLLPMFVIWVERQVRRSRPALIPNALWMIPSFSAITTMIAISFAVLNALELFCSLYFQEIQNLSALQAAIQILPSLIIGTLLNVTTGLFVHKVRVFWLAVVSTVLTALAPLLMAVCDPNGSYWTMPFIAQLLQPISCDILFTVGLIVITEAFPEEKHALAGAVFNTAAQFGNASGLALMQVVLTLVTASSRKKMPASKAELVGFRAGFWTMFGLMLACVLVGGAGFWKTGKIGVAQQKPKADPARYMSNKHTRKKQENTRGAHTCWKDRDSEGPVQNCC